MLFLSGPLHRQRIAVPDDLRHYVALIDTPFEGGHHTAPPPPPKLPPKVLYERRRIRIADRDVAVFALSTNTTSMTDHALADYLTYGDRPETPHTFWRS